MKNKYILLTTVLLLSMTTSLQAQDNTTDFREKLQFGLKVGLNYSNVYDSKGEEFDADGKFGFAGGGFVAIPIGKYFGIQPEVLLSQKGFQATGILLGSSYKFTRTTTYLDIPIFFAFKPSEFVTILGGPQYAYLLNRKDVFANGSTSIEQEVAFENDNIRKNTLCFVLGADLTMKRLVVGARAGWDIQNNNGDGSSTVPRYKNVWYQLTVGMRF